MNEIQSWLTSDRNYQQGVELYNRFGNSSSLKRVLANGATSRNIETLVYELQKLVKAVPATSHAPKTIVLKATVIKNPETKFEPVSSIQRNNQQVMHLIEAKNRLFKEYVATFHTIELLPEDQRREAALKCLSLMEEVQKLWDKIDYFDAHGMLPREETPEEKKPSEMDKAELLLLVRNSVRPGISRYKRLIQTAKTEQTRIKYEGLMQKYELQLKECESLINR